MWWSVPKIWDGGDCWILGGGASLTEQFGVPKEVVKEVFDKKRPPSVYSTYLKPLHDKHVIGINAAYLIGNWIDVCFFGDRRWYFDNREQLRSFDGLIIGCSPFLNKKEFEREGVLYLARDKTGYGISKNPKTVCWNLNSGAAAISIAANAGCKRIILVGFDMKLDNESNQHWHKLYKRVGSAKLPYQLPFHRHLRGFDQIAVDAKQRGIEIINASPESAITQFRKVTVKELL